MSPGQPTQPDGAAVELGTSALEQARSRRLALGDAADRVEELIARPGPDPRWTERVTGAMSDLRTAFTDHVEEVESPDGLLPHLLSDSPRLANAITRMYTDHTRIADLIETTCERLVDCGDACDGVAVDSVRAATVDILAMISKHRQAGADLVYEAYHVDIGGG
ncbi:MAG: hypothetical protein ACE5GB_01980 [Acidimicrobiales bacterium]